MHLLQLLLGSELVGVATLLLSAVGGSSVVSRVALSADHLLAVVLLSEDLKRRLDDTTSESEDQMESGLLLDVVVGKGSAILELLTSEDESLLVWRDSFLVLDLGLDIFDSVGSLDLKGDGLTRKGLNEDLHESGRSERKTKLCFGSPCHKSSVGLI